MLSKSISLGRAAWNRTGSASGSIVACCRTLLEAQRLATVDIQDLDLTRTSLSTVSVGCGPGGILCC